MLKASSKKVPQERKRRKIDLLGTFEQFKQSIEEVKQEDPGMIPAINPSNYSDQ